jgi:hypothetical protein
LVGVILNVFAPFSNGFFQGLGSELGRSAGHSLSTFPVGDIPIIISIAGFGLIAYGVIHQLRIMKRRKPDIEELAREVRKQQNKEELEQIDRQNNHQSERDDKFTPANIK